MYKEAIEEVPIEEKVDKIRQKEGYTKISELPQTYLEAVISVEDHRFYKHPGIDIISIGRAIINDIKAMEFIEGGSIDRIVSKRKTNFQNSTAHFRAEVL